MNDKPIGFYSYQDSDVTYTIRYVGFGLFGISRNGNQFPDEDTLFSSSEEAMTFLMKQFKMV